MSLDVLNSKEIDIQCSSLRCDVFQSPVIDTDLIQLETLSDVILFSHEISNGNSTTKIKSDKLEHVIGVLYPQESVIYHITTGLKLFYRANTNTSTTPPNADWTYLGTPFIESVVWLTGSLLVVYEGYYYTCIADTTINTPFNPAQWTKNGQADTEVGDTTILENRTTVSETDIRLGKNSKDFEGMLILHTPQSAVSEVISRTGNIVLQPASGTPSVPPSLNDKGVINYDISNNFYLRKSKATATDISNSFIFEGLTNDTSTTTQLCVIHEKYYTGNTAVFGEITSNIVKCNAITYTDLDVLSQTFGSATLAGTGVIIVNTKAMGPASKIFISRTTFGATGVAGLLRISHKSQNSFTVSSNSATDTSVFDWFIINPNFSA